MTVEISLDRSWARRILHGLGAIAFPSDCLVCGELLVLPLSGPLCADCLAALPPIEPPFCSRCGLPYDASVAAGPCGPCRSGARAFRRARAAFEYVDDVRLCVHALKFGGRMRLASVLGEVAAERWLRPNELDGYTALVPVPLSRRRWRNRGFNQAELVAKAVAKAAGAPVLSSLLVKTEDRPPQAGLSASARKENARSAYRGRIPAAIRGRAVLLVDDVLTTGATADAAARALLRAGAGAVDVLTLARVP